MQTYRSIITMVFCLLAMMAGTASGADTVLKPRTSHRTPPPLTLVDLEGKRHSLAEYRGKVVVINFFGTWCPPCLQEMPSLMLLARALKDQPFTVLAVSVNDSPARLRQVFGAQQSAFTILLDSSGRAARSWGALGFPTSYVLDAESRIRYSAEGPLAWDDVEVAKKIVALLPKATSPSADAGVR